MNLEVRLINNEQELEAVLRIREEVFIKGQNVDREIELDGREDEADHVIALLDDKPIGCTRIRYPKGKAKLERLAVLPEHQGKGFGKQIFEFVLDYCKSKKLEEIYMNSQYYIKDFYKKFGFKEVGKAFDEAGIKHIKMVLDS